MTIRDFIYLDSGRMYSLYSQVFEGVADKVVNTYFNKYATDNLVKKVIAGENIMSSTEETLTEMESMIMYDNLYNKLEDKLNGAIKNVNNLSTDITLDSIKDAFIYKISGNAFVHDYIRLAEFTDKFNKLGEIIASSIYNSLPANEKNTINLKQVIAREGLGQDKNLLANIKYVAEFFNNNSYEVIIDPCISDSDIIFKGILKREYLRMDEHRIRHLYTNEPSMKWIMVGQITYIPNERNTEENNLSSSEENQSISDSYYNIIHTSNGVERDFSNSNRFKKIHIAPIAIYVEQEIANL